MFLKSWKTGLAGNSKTWALWSHLPGSYTVKYPLCVSTFKTQAAHGCLRFCSFCWGGHLERLLREELFQNRPKAQPHAARPSQHLLEVVGHNYHVVWLARHSSFQFLQSLADVVWSWSSPGIFGSCQYCWLIIKYTYCTIATLLFVSSVKWISQTKVADNGTKSTSPGVWALELLILRSHPCLCRVAHHWNHFSNLYNEQFCPVGLCSGVMFLSQWEA